MLCSQPSGVEGVSAATAGPACSGRGRGKGMPVCAIAKVRGRLRGNGTGPLIGWAAGIASAAAGACVGQFAAAGPSAANGIALLGGEAPSDAVLAGPVEAIMMLGGEGAAGAGEAEELLARTGPLGGEFAGAMALALPSATVPSAAGGSFDVACGAAGTAIAAVWSAAALPRTLARERNVGSFGGPT